MSPGYMSALPFSERGGREGEAISPPRDCRVASGSSQRQVGRRVGARRLKAGLETVSAVSFLSTRFTT